MLRDQRRGLQCLPGILYREPRRGELTKLVIDERQELRGRPRIARFIRGEDAGDLPGHPAVRLAEFLLDVWIAAHTDARRKAVS